MSGLLMSHREKISCMWHFQTVVLKRVLLRVVVSNDMTMDGGNVFLLYTVELT